MIGHIPVRQCAIALILLVAVAACGTPLTPWAATPAPPTPVGNISMVLMDELARDDVLVRSVKLIADPYPVLVINFAVRGRGRATHHALPPCAQAMHPSAAHGRFLAAVLDAPLTRLRAIPSSDPVRSSPILCRTIAATAQATANIKRPYPSLSTAARSTIWRSA
jgi:hypothetical protein